MPELIDSSRPPSNDGEEKMQRFLLQLPAGYWVFREFSVSEENPRNGNRFGQKRPDFLVLAPDVGLVSIEVKDWDIQANTYRWRDQDTVIRKARDGREEEVANPAAQADAYYYALKDLIEDVAPVFVTSYVAFPNVARQDFLNRIADLKVIKNPQSRFLLNLDRTIFKDDLDRHVSGPDVFLRALVRRNPGFHPSRLAEIDWVFERLLPRHFAIDDLRKRQDAKQKVGVLDAKQRDWVLSLDEHSWHLLDVAGSGKTTALVAKALHLVDAAKGQPPRILLTTYNENLANNIRRILRRKKEEAKKRYDSIEVASILVLMRQIVEKAYDDKAPENATEENLRADVESILADQPDLVRVYDHVFVDEVQDFDALYLQIVDHLSISGRLFFVGDIGQRIYQRTYNLSQLRELPADIELKRTLAMYRTPRGIAELATRFVFGSPLTEQDLTDFKYREDKIVYPSPLDNYAVMMRSNNELADLVRQVQDYLSAGRLLDELMLIADEGSLPRIESSLEKAGIRCGIGDRDDGDAAVTLVSYENAKGLEKPVVIVSGIEHLFESMVKSAILQSAKDRDLQEQLCRRKVYVSLTRCTEELIILYRDPSNRLVADLLKYDAKLQERRTHGSQR